MAAGSAHCQRPAFPAHQDDARLEDDDLEPLSDVEREHIMRALQHAAGNKKKAAALLGVSRRALYRNSSASISA